MTDIVEDILNEYGSKVLTHHGIRGMRWGHRKEQVSTGTERQSRFTPEQKARAKKVAIGVGVTAAVVGVAATIYILKRRGSTPVRHVNDGSSSEGNIAIRALPVVKELVTRRGGEKVPTAEYRYRSQLAKEISVPKAEAAYRKRNNVPPGMSIEDFQKQVAERVQSAFRKSVDPELLKNPAMHY